MQFIVSCICNGEQVVVESYSIRDPPDAGICTVRYPESADVQRLGSLQRHSRFVDHTDRILTYGISSDKPEQTEEQH